MKFIVFLFVFNIFTPIFAGQDGNGGFLLYGDLKKLVDDAKNELVVGIQSTSPDFFTTLPKPVSYSAFLNIISNGVVIDPSRFDSRKNPDKQNDLLTMDYDKDKNTVEILGPLLIILASKNKIEAVEILQRALILEALHNFDYNQDEAQKTSDLIYNKIFKSRCTDLQIQNTPKDYTCIAPKDPAFSRYLQMWQDWASGQKTQNIKMMMDTRANTYNSPITYEVYFDLSNPTATATMSESPNYKLSVLGLRKYDQNEQKAQFEKIKDPFGIFKSIYIQVGLKSRTVYVEWADIQNPRRYVAYDSTGPIYISHPLFK